MLRAVASVKQLSRVMDGFFKFTAKKSIPSVCPAQGVAEQKDNKNISSQDNRAEGEENFNPTLNVVHHPMPGMTDFLQKLVILSS